jgi:hypothetical protein
MHVRPHWRLEVVVAVNRRLVIIGLLLVEITFFFVVEIVLDFVVEGNFLVVVIFLGVVETFLTVDIFLDVVCSDRFAEVSWTFSMNT